MDHIAASPSMAESVLTQETSMSARTGRSMFAGAIGRVVNPVIACVDVNGVIRQIDVNEVMQRVDWNDVIDAIDWNNLMEHIDVDAVMQRVDVNAVVERVDVSRIPAFAFPPKGSYRYSWKNTCFICCNRSTPSLNDPI